MRHEGQSLGDEAHYLQSFLQEKLGTLGYQQMWLSTLLLLIHCHGQPILQAIKAKVQTLGHSFAICHTLCGKGREGKGREGKGREGKGREGKGREGKEPSIISGCPGMSLYVGDMLATAWRNPAEICFWYMHQNSTQPDLLRVHMWDW